MKEKHKCFDCANCDREHLRCHPNAANLMEEYALETDDLHYAEYCDYFKEREDNRNVQNGN